MNNKTILITGGSKGIGKETAKLLAATGARIIIACRNLENGEKACEEIVLTTNNSNIALRLVDLSDFKSVREFADKIVSTEFRLDVLIHCAAILLDKNMLAPNGFDLTMATNTMGPFLLTHLLVDLLKRSAPSRIVYMTSSTHFYGKITFDELNNYIPSKWPQYNYFNSKFANVCIANELARRLEQLNVTVNSVHPGIVIPEKFKSVPLPAFIRKKIFKTPEEGAVFIANIALNDELLNVTGQYFNKFKKSHMSIRTMHEEKNQETWEILKIQTGVSGFDPRM